jgi:hypothetical protein
MVRTYRGLIDTLDPHEIFVYGQNTQARNGKGSALTANQKFGGKNGVLGFCGQSYGIITKDLTKWKHPSVSPEFIRNQIFELYTFAVKRFDLVFYVAYSGMGTNLNGYTPIEMASFFVFDSIPENIVFEENFWLLMKQFNSNIV